MLKVGIHENLVVTKALINDQGSLVIGVAQGGIPDPIAALSASGNTSFKRQEQDFLIYPPKVTNFEGNTDTFENIMDKIAEIKDPLDSILGIYLTADKRKWDPFAGIALENIKTTLLTEATLNKVYNNIVTQFVAMIKPFAMETGGKKVRMILIRQSQAKHYPKLRNKYLDSYPFIESMEIPLSASKLKFTNYEKTKGFDNPNPVGGAQTVNAVEAAEAATLFN